MRERERERNKHPNRQMTITHLIINSISKPDVINLLLCQNTNTNFATGVAFKLSPDLARLSNSYSRLKL